MRKILHPGFFAGAVFLFSLLVWAFLFRGKLPAVTDEILFSYPSQAVNLAAWEKGLVPLWDPTTGCGMPQLGNDLSACLYPPFWLFHFTGLSQWLVWMSLLHTALAFLGFYLWARNQKIQNPWAVLGAVSFAGSLHMTRIWAYPMFSAAQCWTPWVFFTAGRFLEAGKRRWWLALAGALALQILAGYPFFSFYTGIFLAAWIFLKPLPAFKRWQMGAAAGMALALTSAQVLPFLDFLSNAGRGGWGSPDRYPYFLRGGELLTLFSPTALGIPGAAGYQGQSPNSNFMLYFGLIPLLAWITGFLFPKTFTPRFWTWSALIWLLWMMGGAFPLWRVIPERVLEALDPSKAVGVFLFAALTGACLGLTRFFQARLTGILRDKVCWAAACLWLLDVLLIPARTVYPVPDPFLKPEIQAWAQRVAGAVGGQRIVSLHVKSQTVAKGEGNQQEAFADASGLWVRDFLTNSNNVWGIRSSHAYLSTWTKGMELLWKNFNQSASYAGRLADLAGVKALYFPIELEAPHYRVLEKDGDDYLMSNEHCLPDAWIAGDSKTFEDRDSLLSQLEGEASLSTPPTIVYLEKTEKLPPPERNLRPPEVSIQGWERQGATRAVFSGNVTGANPWLVWNEAYTPGWRAWVNGNPAPIARAFGFFMAVPAVPRGNHSIEFRYEPVSVRVGFFVSLLCWWLLMAGMAWKKTQSRVPTP